LHFFKEIINFIESLKKQGLSFKVLPKNTAFIGSDNSNEEGDYKIRVINYIKCNLYLKYLVISQTENKNAFLG
jgi:hypothetical protein